MERIRVPGFIVIMEEMGAREDAPRKLEGCRQVPSRLASDRVSV